MTTDSVEKERKYHRKIIRIKAEQSPNVRYALWQINQGMKPTNEIIVPGVLTYEEYINRRKTWNIIEQTIGLDAEFYEGAELKLFPKEWLDRAKEVARKLPRNRKAEGIGIDPAEGGDKTAMVASDRLGVIECRSKKTPDTSVITSEALAFMQYHGLKENNHRVIFDRGGGGKQHADRLRKEGHKGIRTIAFGEPIIPDPKRGLTPIAHRKEQREERYTFKNRRAQLYGELRELLDPSLNPTGFGIPEEYTMIFDQLEKIPLTYDNESKLFLLPKTTPAKSDLPSLTKLIGHSPDESDALVLSVHAWLHEARKVVAGVV